VFFRQQQLRPEASAGKPKTSHGRTIRERGRGSIWRGTDFPFWEQSARWLQHTKSLTDVLRLGLLGKLALQRSAQSGRKTKSRSYESKKVDANGDLYYIV
jgi:hypothetical protein